MTLFKIIALFILMAWAPYSAQATENTIKIKMSTTKGDIVLELYPQQAPKTVANFLTYVDNGFFVGTQFHRVIPGFMIQGGGFDDNLQQKPTLAPIPNEANTTLTNQRGTLAMARTSDPHSATAQFFINLVDNAFLNYRAPNAKEWGYCVFGRVIEGMDVVDAIGNTPTGAKGPFSRDVPRTMIQITAVKRLPSDEPANAPASATPPIAP